MDEVRGAPLDASLVALPGVERLRRMRQGLISRPPLSHLLGWEITQVGVGTATVVMPTSPMHLNVLGFVEPGGLAGIATEAAIIASAPAGHEVTITGATAAVYRPTTLDSGSLVARARTTNTGRSFTFAEGTVEDSLGRTVAQVTTSATLGPPTEAGAPGSATPPVEYQTPDPWERTPSDLFRFDVWDSHSGLEAMEMMRSGELGVEPRSKLFSAKTGSVVEPGVVEIRLPASGWLAGFDPSVSAAVVFYWMPVAMGGSATTLIAAAHRVGFLHTAVGILQPTPLDDRDLVFRGEATECANGFVHVTGTTTNAGGDIVAVANAIGKIVARDARSPRAKQVERKLLTVLFTDIVGSTQAATELGDDRWQELLAEHHRIMRDQLAIFDGHEVKTTGDGFLLTFESPAQAIAFAASVRLSLQRIGVKITAGIHTGECELSDDDIAGIAVHTAARVMGAAQPDEILVTGVVCDLVAGSSHSFSERGTHELKGIDRPQQLFQVDA